MHCTVDSPLVSLERQSLHGFSTLVGAVMVTFQFSILCTLLLKYYIPLLLILIIYLLANTL